METNNTIPKVTPEQIAACVERIQFTYMVVPNTTTTLCIALLDGKFSLAIGKSACVDPRLYDAKKGEELAYNEALALAKNKLWELEGYRLYDRIHTDFANEGGV